MVSDEYEVGQVYWFGGERRRYLGGSLWEKVDPLAKRFDASDEEMTEGVRESLARYGIEIECD